MNGSRRRIYCRKWSYGIGSNKNEIFLVLAGDKKKIFNHLEPSKTLKEFLLSSSNSMLQFQSKCQWWHFLWIYIISLWTGTVSKISDELTSRMRIEYYPQQFSNLSYSAFGKWQRLFLFRTKMRDIETTKHSKGLIPTIFE